MLQQVLKISNVRKTAPNKNSQRRVHNFFWWIMNFQIKFVEYITQFCIVHNNSWFNIQMYDKFKFVSLPFIVRSFSVTCPFVVRFVRFLYVAFPFCPLLLRYLYGEARYVSVTCPVDLRYSYGTFPFNILRGSLGQRRRRLSRTDDQRTKVFGRFFIR